jgi:hypothetical protein
MDGRMSAIHGNRSNGNEVDDKRGADAMRDWILEGERGRGFGFATVLIGKIDFIFACGLELCDPRDRRNPGQNACHGGAGIQTRKCAVIKNKIVSWRFKKI